MHKNKSSVFMNEAIIVAVCTFLNECLRSNCMQLVLRS
jgi:hypothetical protein